MYDDDYPTCQACHATLCVYGIPFEQVSQALGVGDTSHQGPDANAPNRKHGWFLASKDAVRSKDARRHLDWILDQLSDPVDAIDELRRQGARCVISCYWLSAHGHGGPAISGEQAAKLGLLKLELLFDVYLGDRASRPMVES
jgi:hypothetical protein